MDLELQNLNIDFTVKLATNKEVFLHLQKCNTEFYPPLNTRVNLENFSKKIFLYAITFEAWFHGELIGLLGVYFNNHKEKIGFINHISILSSYKKNHIATKLLDMAMKYAIDNGFKEIQLEVSKKNNIAINLYKKFGFIGEKIMSKKINDD